MFGIKKDKPTTLEEVKKAYERLSDEDKAKFKESYSDRVDESVGAQEEADGQKDEQTAEDRVDEAEATETADESESEPAEIEAEKADEKAESEPEDEQPAEESGEPVEENAEDEQAEAEQKQVFILDRIADLLEKLVSQKSDKDESKLAESSKKYATGLNGGYAGEKGGDKYNPEDVERLLRNK